MSEREAPSSATFDIAHRSPISGIDAYRDRYVATAGYDSQVILWDGADGLPLANAWHDHLVNQCRFSPDGRLLLTASSDYTARTWSVGGLTPVAVLRGHEDDVEMASWSPDGQHVATASRDHRIRIFDLAGTLVRSIAGHEADVLSVEWRSDGEALVSSSDDGTVRRWEVASGTEQERFSLGGETDTVVITRSGTLFAGNDRGEIITLRNGLASITPGHGAGIKRLVFDEATQRLMSASYDRTVKLWATNDSGDLRLAQQSDVPATIWLRAATFASRDRLLFGSFGSSYAEYSPSSDTWRVDRIEDTPGINAGTVHDGAVYSVGDAGVVRRDGAVVARLGSLCNFIHGWAGRLVTGGQLGILFDAVSGEILHRHHSPLNCAASWAMAGGERLVVGAYTGEGLVFAQDGDGVVRFEGEIMLHDNAVKGVACDGHTLFSVCATAAMARHDAVSLDLIERLSDAHDKIANGAARLPGGGFVSVSRDRKLRLWTDSGCRAIPTPHDHSIKCVAALDGARRIATGSYDGKVAIYDLAADDWPIVRQISRFGISSLMADDAANAFIATSYDGQFYRIPMAE
ncbi:WD40 repeat domain-containing protein [Sphingomonas alpina]|uniref:WD40 repeat domain-containing protein n=1 Tax=Sphingomonas alpina TaxID=653931 RepID=A0A7H0LFQ0_9SPHN|nr:WD40 repeat domain-containing protein [Sphingomonas alpina]QNQ08503.1 WD40 repeat domain-containing protein [Sphingomonas alpina]